MKKKKFGILIIIKCLVNKKYISSQYIYEIDLSIWNLSATVWVLQNTWRYIHTRWKIINVQISFIWQKHKTFRNEVRKRNVTDGGASSTRTLALLNLLLTAQTFNHKRRVKRISDHVTDRRTSPKINSGSLALCPHQILRGQKKLLTYT